MNRVTLVTGASQGIGKAISMAFAESGSDLVLAARNVSNLEATAGEARELGVETLVVRTDVMDEGSVRAMADAALERFGRVDTVVANSGVAGPTKPLWQVEPAEWAATMAVNVTGVFLVCRALLPAMIERRSGSVIVIGSISGKRPLWGRTPYTTGKAGLIGLVRTLAWEAGPHGIRVNLVSPGFVAGPRIDAVVEAQAEARGLAEDEVRAGFAGESPLHRLTEVGEVAAACVYLASDAAAGITGADLNVNSGVVMY